MRVREQLAAVVEPMMDDLAKGELMLNPATKELFLILDVDRDVELVYLYSKSGYQKWSTLFACFQLLWVRPITVKAAK
jgi:hypothetical protein